MIWPRMLGSPPGSVFLLALAIRLALVSSLPGYQNSSSTGDAPKLRDGIRVPVSPFSNSLSGGVQRVGNNFRNPIILDDETRNPMLKIGGMDAKVDSSGFTTFDGGGWTCSVTIGGQDLTLNLDTGSSDLWTASSLMSEAQQKSISTGQLYSPDGSSRLEQLQGYKFDVAYADGSAASGIVGRDTVTISGATVYNFAFGIASNITYSGGSSDSGTRQTDGPVGLGFGATNSIQPSPQCTFMECLSPNLQEPIFCTSLKLNDSGTIDFGVIDQKAYSGRMTVVPINNQTEGHPGQWIVSGIRAAVGGTRLQSQSFSLNFDTGGPGMVLPEDVAAQYFSRVQNSTNTNNSDGLWTYPCDNTLPDLSLVFSRAISGPGITTIPGSILGDAILTSTKNPQMCFTKIQTTNTGGVGNAGVPFYATKYMVFNQSRPSLGFADQIGN